jgi:hypothetical protein
MNRLNCFSKNGKHKNNELEEIYSFQNDNMGHSEGVVRWCPICGAIVVDIDYDGRTLPGNLVPLRFPDHVRQSKNTSN